MSEDLPLRVSVQEVDRLLSEEKPILLLDCRQQEEYDLVRLSPSTLIPMDELPDRVSELRNQMEERIVVYCHMGVRSEMVCQWLRERGFPNVQTMTGGIDAWALTIDTSLPRY